MESTMHRLMLTSSPKRACKPRKISPRDASDQRGPYEEALLGTPVADPEQPLELRQDVGAWN